MDLLGVLEQAGPELSVELLLLQLQLDVLASVVDLGRLVVDLSVQLEVEVVGLLEGIRVSGEGQAGRLQLKLQICSRDVGNGDSHVDVVLRGFDARRALGPEDCRFAQAVS